MDNFLINETQFLNFFIIFVRINGLLLAAPLFGDKFIPIQIRIALSLILTIMLSPVIKLNPWLYTPHILVLLHLVICELLIGLILGFATKLLFAGVQLSGQLMGYQMGFAMANVFDPLSSSQISILGQFQNLLALLIFLTINAHHLFIKAIVDSFRLIPPLEIQLQGRIIEKIMAMTSHMFILAIQLGAPIIAVLIFTNVFLAVMARTIPEMNIFMVAMPLSIAIGLFILVLSMPFCVRVMIKVFNQLNYDLMVLLKGM